MSICQLSDFPEHARHIGYIIGNYGEIEYVTGACIGHAIKSRTAGLKAMFRMTGQNARIEAADAILRPAFEKQDLKNEYEGALGAVRFSRKLRNQYAHAHWLGFEKEGLYFTDMEDAAKGASAEIWYTMHHIDVPLLEKQSNYVHYALSWLVHLDHEYRKREGLISSHDWPAPKIIEQPPLHNPIKEHPLPRTVEDDEQAPEEPLPESH
jgi:hypothetical protein